jgi:hypothetical protein
MGRTVPSITQAFLQEQEAFSRFRRARADRLVLDDLFASAASTWRPQPTPHAAISDSAPGDAAGGHKRWCAAGRLEQVEGAR